MKKKKLLHQCADAVSLPKDFSQGAFLLTATGREELLVENYRGIEEYTSCCIRILARTCLVEVTGEQLTIDAYTREEMVITGCICQIRYLDRPGGRRCR